MRLERFVVTDFQRFFSDKYLKKHRSKSFHSLSTTANQISASIPTLDNQSLSKCPLVEKSQSLHCSARIDVESIALPFTPAVAIFKGQFRPQGHSLCHLLGFLQ